MEGWVVVSELVRNFGLLGAAVVGLILAGMRVVAANRQAQAALRQAELSRRDHVAELFNRAVGQLDDQKLQVRLGAIYTLRQIAQDFPDLTGPVLELLTIYVRETGRAYDDPAIAPDVREIMRIVTGSEGHEKMASSRGIVRPPGFVIDLHGAFLRRVDVSQGDLENANLAGADLSEAKLRGVNFNNANLKGTILRGADLREARNLTWKQLSEAVIDDSTRLPDYLGDSRLQGQSATEG